MAEEARPYDVLARRVHSFSGPEGAGVVHAVHVVHGPAYGVPGTLPRSAGHEGFHAPSGGADKHQRGFQVRVVEELLPQRFCLFGRFQVVDVHHHQARRLRQAVAPPAAEDAAGCHVGQCLLLHEAAGVAVVVQGGLAYVVRQGGQPFVGGDELVHFR